MAPDDGKKRSRFGTYLDVLMAQRGLTATALAEKAGIDRTVLSKIMTGEREPTKGQRIQLESVLRVPLHQDSIDFLLDDDPKSAAKMVSDDIQAADAGRLRGVVQRLQRHLAPVEQDFLLGLRLPPDFEIRNDEFENFILDLASVIRRYLVLSVERRMASSAPVNQNREEPDESS